MAVICKGRLPLTCIGAALLASLQGCASFYLHNAATQKQTDSAQSALGTLKTDSIFDSEASYLNSLQVTESSAVTAKFAAQRDHDILLILNGTGPGGKDGLTTLKARIDGYLLSLVGATDATVKGTPCQPKFWRAVDLDPSKIWSQESDLTSLDQNIQKLAQTVNSSCPPSTFPALTPVSPSSSVDGAIQLVIADLRAIQQLKKAADDAAQELKAALADAETKLASGHATATDVDSDLKKLQAALTDANPLIRQYVSATLSTKVAATIDALSPPSSKAQSAITNEERSGIAVMQALFGVGDALASPPRVPHPNALAAAQSWLNYVGSQATIELQSRQITLKDHQAQLAAVLTTVYYLSKAGEEVQAISLSRVRALKDTEGLGDLIDSKDDNITRAVDGTLVYYAAAWTRGFAVDAIASRRGYIDERRAKLTIGRAASAAWLGSLKPAVETLATYGAGGFDPQTVAQLIQALGVLGVAAGVNR